MQNTLDMHRASPDVSLERYVRARQIELARSLDGVPAIYLDTNFWITLRNAAAGRESSTEAADLLQRLRIGVNDGKIFCPISDGTLAELFKQKDPTTRMATARLIDQLSLGVALIPFERRVATELAHFIYAQARVGELHSVRDLVWTKLSYALGELHPTETAFDAATVLALQKAFVDHLWTQSLTQMMQAAGGVPPPLPEFDDLAKRLNASNATHADELKSFAHAYTTEIAGAIDVVIGTVLDILGAMHRKTTGLSALMDDHQRSEYERMWRNLLIAAFKKDPTKNTLRSLHINTCLHVSVRWNRWQKFEANDFIDFRHACAALAHCQAFFTEASLASWVTAKNVALDRRYGCYVASDVRSALTFIKSIR